MLTDRSRNARRSALCSTLAIATALVVGAGSAHAQSVPGGSFQGAGTFTFGNGSIFTAPGVTDITIATPQAVIDWTMLPPPLPDGRVIFQPAGTTATFTNDAMSTSNFAVLNRIFPTDPANRIQFDGTVISQLQSFSTSGAARGGTVFFYSPGGIIIGSQAVFNVGNLGLTSSPVAVDGNGNWLSANNSVSFGVANPNSSVAINQGAQINIGNAATDGYLGIVAPQITNAGTINVDGAAALVSADAATITFNQNGLFDIQINSGTSSTGNAGDGRTLVNTGSIGGPAFQGTGANHRIYLVAVPKNDAITMIIGNGSSLGFDVAGAANVVGNAIILSAGHDVIGGEVSTTRSAGGGTGTVAIDAFNAAFTSDVRGRATGRALFAADGSVSPGASSFAANLTMHSDTIVSLESRSNGTISVTGNVTLDADKFGSAINTTVTAGQAYLDAGNGAQINIGGNAEVRATGHGSLAGSSGNGGSASISANSGGAITVNGSARARADGRGGAGASGQGGSTTIFAGTGGDISFGSLNATADGFGGGGGGTGVAGAGTGGSANITVNGAGSTVTIPGLTATTNFNDRKVLSAEGFGGGIGLPGTTAGTGTGGNVAITVSAGGALTLPNIATTNSFDQPNIRARGNGGLAFADGSTGGLGVGGSINIVVDGGTMTSGPTQVSAVGIGGTFGTGATGNINGGDGTGGQRNISVRNGGTLSIGLPGGVAGGVGGNALGTGAGGDGTNGSASLTVDNGTVNFTSRSIILTQVFAGNGAVGGNASGGSTNVSIVNGGVVNVSDDPSSGVDLLIASNSFGGQGLTGGVSGGNAQAGVATLNINGGTLAGAGQVTIDAVAQAGGDQVSTGGEARGGTAQTFLNNATINIGALAMSSQAFGGSIGAGRSGTAGAAFGGLTQLISQSGTNTITASDVGLDSDALGGNLTGTGGTGGAAVGGSTRLVANGGSTLTINSIETTVSSDGEGGGALSAISGDGGDGTSGLSDVFANGGTLVINGDLFMESDADGGDGLNGGDALNDFDASTAIVRAQNGSITVSGTTAMSADAFGGESLGNGGTGGSAQAGFAVIDALSSLAGGSLISLHDVFISAPSGGGTGGAGAVNGTGGIGGGAQGGNVQVFGNAGNGRLVIDGVLTADASAVGGSGGAANIESTSGAGGLGGTATGGFVQFGTRSGLDTPGNDGSAVLGDVIVQSNGTGGTGGAGGTGANGGAGGGGFAGQATLLSRGSPVTAGDVTFNLVGQGGNGGAGAIQGVGGNGYAGSSSVLVTQRFNRTERGSLTAGTIGILTSGAGGAGSTAGLSYYADSGQVTVQQSDASIANLFYTNQGTTRPDYQTIGFVIDPVTGQQVQQTFTNAVFPIDLAVTQGTLNVAGTLSMETPGDLRLTLDAGTINVANLNLDAGNFVLPAAPPVAPGTINVSNSLGLFSNLDILTYANFVTPFGVFFDTIGSFQTGDFTADSINVIVDNGFITMGNLRATSGDVVLDASQALTVGNVSATEIVELDAGTTLTAGALVAGDNATASSGGALNVLSASAGIVNQSASSEAEYNVGLRSLTSVTAGALTARANIGLSSPGTVTVGDLSAGQAVLGLAGTGLTTGSITTPTSGRVYLANFSMEALGGAIGDNFDPAPIFAATPVPVAGPITINGPVSTGLFQAATTQAFTSGAITAASSLQIAAGQGITTGALSATEDIGLSSGVSLTLGAITTNGGLFIDTGGSLTTGNLQAREIELDAVQAITTGTLSAAQGIDVAAGGALLTGAVTAGQGVDLRAGSTLTAGNITAGNEAGSVFSIGAIGAGAVTLGNLTATSGIGILSQTGSITAGNIVTGTSLLALARGAVNLGSVTTGATGNLYIANSSMAGLGGALDDSFNPAPIFAAAPTPTTGPITIGGPVSSGILTAATTGNFTAGNLTLGTRLTIGRAATAQVDGAWIAPTISIASQRLLFGTASNAGIGAQGTTQNVTLRALGSGQTAVLGGTTQGSGYTLTQSDANRVRTSNLTIQVDPQGSSSSTTPDLEVRDLSLTGSAGGGMSSVTITTPGSARVTGDLVLAQAAATDQLTLNASRRLEIVLPDGSISITGAGGALAGTLTLSSDNLVAGTLTLLQQIMADPEAAGLADALKTPASTTSNLAGYIRANGVRLLSNANILLQNSGTASDFAGVTVGGGGLIIGRLTPSAGPGTGTGTGSSTGFSFVGMLMTPDEVLMFEFQVDTASTVTLRTYSYAGGVNAAGQTIPSGGFDPILALFDAAGLLINQNDDGGSNVPADPNTGARFDTFLAVPVQPGNYTVSVSVFPNFAIGPNLSNGFSTGASFNGRTANFAFDVLGATSAEGPGSQNGPLNVIGFGRQVGANGQSVTGNVFFEGIDFSDGPETTIEFSEGSQFNTCLISGGCQGPELPAMDRVAAISSEILLVSEDTLAEEPFEDTAEEEDEAEADEASSPIAPPNALIDTRPLNPAVDVVEPVSGAGNPALIGSAVNETTAQGETP